VGSNNESTSHQLWKIAKPLLLVAIVGYFGWLLFTNNLKNVTWAGVTQALTEVRAWRIAAAVALTCLNYMVLICYDAIALYYLEHSLSPRRTAFGSIVGYAFSHNFGWIAGGSAVRFRIYSQWGFSAIEIAKLIATLTLTFWVGVFTLAGIAFIVEPLRLPKDILSHLPSWLPITTTFPFGIASLFIIGIYLILCAVWHKPIKFMGWSFVSPPLSLSVVQIIVASIEQLIAASIFYILLPEDVRQKMDFLEALNVYLLFTVVAALLHIPGGVVVLEKIVLDFMGEQTDNTSALTASLVIYRLIFYVLPLAVAGMMMLGNEVRGPGESQPNRATQYTAKRLAMIEKRKKRR
jgi:uncharacterized membrane protein YbhN (UPF0104 family)